MPRRADGPRPALLAAVAALVACAGAAQADTYRWVDEKGVVHYGDNVPPEYSKRERDLLNEQGITVERLPAEPTAEELLELERQRQEELRRQKVAEEQRKYDRILLNTYLSTADIERLRDERLETLASRLRLNDHAIRNLRNRLIELEERAAQYNYPYDVNSDKAPLPDRLAEDLLETVNSLSRREQDADDIIAERERIRARFDADIVRFKLLKGEPEIKQVSNNE